MQRTAQSVGFYASIALVALAAASVMSFKRSVDKLRRAASLVDIDGALELTPAKPQPRSSFVDTVVRATDFEWLFAWADPQPAPESAQIAELQRWSALVKDRMNQHESGPCPALPDRRR